MICEDYCQYRCFCLPIDSPVIPTQEKATSTGEANGEEKAGGVKSCFFLNENNIKSDRPVSVLKIFLGFFLCFLLCFWVSAFICSTLFRNYVVLWYFVLPHRSAAVLLKSTAADR